MRRQLKVKKEYYQLIEKVLEENDSDLLPEDVIDFLYCQYGECKSVYRDSCKVIHFTRKAFLETFAKLYSVIKDEVFALQLGVFVKCIFYCIDGKSLTREKVEEMQEENVWKRFLEKI